MYTFDALPLPVTPFTARTEILLGEAPLRALVARHVCVAGLGGVGGQVAENFARMGLARITVVDHDVITHSNLNRQLVALHSTLGRAKSEVMAERLRDINPAAEIIALNQFLHKSEMDAFIRQGNFDFVVDCIDSIASKAALAAACIHHGTSVAASMGAGNRRDVTKVRVARLNQTHICPLARELRAALRKMGVPVNYPVVYSEEHPAQPLPHQPVECQDGARPRAVNGSIAYMTALFGNMLTGVAVEMLLAQSGENRT